MSFKQQTKYLSITDKCLTRESSLCFTANRKKETSYFADRIFKCTRTPRKKKHQQNDSLKEYYRGKILHKFN